MRGRPTNIKQAQKWEMWQCRKAGVSIATIAGMFGLSQRRTLEILAEQRERESKSVYSRGQFVRYDRGGKSDDDSTSGNNLK